MLALAAAMLAAAATSSAPITLAYGADPAQALDLYVDDEGGAPSPSLKPVAVFFHGGVWQHGDKRDSEDLGRALAKRGFVAVIAGYRLTPHARWPDEGADAAAAVDAALRAAEKHGGDPKQLVLVGHSAGAQMAALLAYDARFLAKHKRAPTDIKALALLSGVFDLKAPLDESQKDGGFAAFVEPTFGTSEQALASASPLVVATKLGVPILCVTSERDYGAMRAQTFAFEKKLRALGEAHVTHLDLPRVDHFGIVHADATADAIAALVVASPH